MNRYSSHLICQLVSHFFTVARNISFIVGWRCAGKFNCVTNESIIAIVRPWVVLNDIGLVSTKLCELLLPVFCHNFVRVNLYVINKAFTAIPFYCRIVSFKCGIINCIEARNVSSLVVNSTSNVTNMGMFGNCDGEGR